MSGQNTTDHVRTSGDIYNIKNHVDYPKLQAQMKAIIQKSLNQTQQLNQKIIALNQTIQKMKQTPLTAEQKKELCQIDSNLNQRTSSPTSLPASSRHPTQAIIQNHPDFSQYIKIRVAEQNLQK